MDADTGREAEIGAGRLPLETVAGHQVAIVVAIAIRGVGRDDAVVFAHHLVAHLHGELQLIVGLHLVEVGIHQLQARFLSFIIEVSIGQGTGLVFRQEAGGADALLDETLQLFFVQAVGGVGTESSIHEEVDRHAVLRGLLQAVDLPVSDLK